MKAKAEDTYTARQIAAVWRHYRKDFIYRALVRGEWKLMETVEEAKAEGATRIEMKRARDVVEFPDYLRAVIK